MKFRIDLFYSSQGQPVALAFKVLAESAQKIGHLNMPPCDLTIMSMANKTLHRAPNCRRL